MQLYSLLFFTSFFDCVIVRQYNYIMKIVMVGIFPLFSARFWVIMWIDWLVDRVPTLCVIHIFHEVKENRFANNHISASLVHNDAL